MKNHYLVNNKTMNETIENFARTKILEGLLQLPEKSTKMFKLMYSLDGNYKSQNEAILVPIEDVVKNMSSEKLNWALSQVEASLKIEKNKE